MHDMLHSLCNHATTMWLHISGNYCTAILLSTHCKCLALELVGREQGQINIWRKDRLSSSLKYILQLCHHSPSSACLFLIILISHTFLPLHLHSSSSSFYYSHSSTSFFIILTSYNSQFLLIIIPIH